MVQRETLARKEMDKEKDLTSWQVTAREFVALAIKIVTNCGWARTPAPRSVSTRLVSKILDAKRSDLFRRIAERTRRFNAVVETARRTLKVAFTTNGTTVGATSKLILAHGWQKFDFLVACVVFRIFETFSCRILVVKNTTYFQCATSGRTGKWSSIGQSYHYCAISHTVIVKHSCDCPHSTIS